MIGATVRNPTLGGETGLVVSQTVGVMYGTFRCPFCSNADLVKTDEEHKHDGSCGDRVWVDELPAMPSYLLLPARDWRADLPDDVLIIDMILAMSDSSERLTAILNSEDTRQSRCPCCRRIGELLEVLESMAA